MNVAVQLDAPADEVPGDTRAERVGLFSDIPTQEFRFTDPGVPDGAV